MQLSLITVNSCRALASLSLKHCPNNYNTFKQTDGKIEVRRKIGGKQANTEDGGVEVQCNISADTLLELTKELQTIPWREDVIKSQ